MCIAYQRSDTVVVGFADGMIRVYDTKTASLLRGMSLGVGRPGAPKHPLVWHVDCLRNGDIVSADSNGEVKFWNGKAYSLMQQVKGHDTDCLDLIVSADGKSLFSAGIDGRMANYTVSSGEHGRKTWARRSHRRVHTCEVKAMAAFDSKRLSVVVSGGSDIALCVTPLRDYGTENPRFPFRAPARAESHQCTESATRGQLVGPTGQHLAHTRASGTRNGAAACQAVEIGLPY